MHNHTYSCRSWDLVGIPCRHDIVAIWMKMGNEDVHEFVHPCYSVENYLKACSGSIKPLPGLEEWPILEREPPMVKAKFGIPKKLRQK